ncbi:hypothetical protein [Ideonella sp. BN130291]|uniref:hypothetical protein n=1 Tax=Ideonella sp. BN130291 TaxID=3112940 RepID=UPI002E26922D|nr:hypothetical protein [Ideonella sp. BN130291]
MREDKPLAKGDPDSSRKGSLNKDPLTGAPGAHPVGVGVGAAAGGLAAGAAVGTVAGPVGTVVGAAVGAVVGGLAGKSVAELVDPTLEDAYWRDNFAGRPYVSPGASYDDYGPAFRYGVDEFNRQEGRTFSEAETDLSAGWHAARSGSRLEWDDAKHATRDAWQRVSDRVERAVPGDSDGDGR